MPADVAALLGEGAASGVPYEDLLVPFAESIVEGDEERIAQARKSLATGMSPEAMVDAAGVASNFERMVRIADATGIELGAYLENASAVVREALGVTRPEGR